MVRTSIACRMASRLLVYCLMLVQGVANTYLTKLMGVFEFYYSVSCSNLFQKGGNLLVWAIFYFWKHHLVLKMFSRIKQSSSLVLSIFRFVKMNRNKNLRDEEELRFEKGVKLSEEKGISIIEALGASCRAYESWARDFSWSKEFVFMDALSSALMSSLRHLLSISSALMVTMSEFAKTAYNF